MGIQGWADVEVALNETTADRLAEQSPEFCAPE